MVMILKATKNGDGSFSIHSDEETLETLWAYACTVAMDEGALTSTRKAAAEIANALATAPGWILMEESEITG